MKTLYTIIFLTLVSILGYSQAPEAFNYQAVMRNASGDILTNTQIAVQISILQDSEAGTAVYVERFNPTTTEYGLIAIKIGKGSVQSGTFSSIDWGAHEYYIMTEVDPNNGTDFTAMGTTQLLSVPYALHTKTAESITGTIPETDPVYTASQASNITASDITNLGNLSGTNTGDQDLSGYLTTEADPVYAASQASNITASDITNLGNLSGTNTGDQDLSGYLTTEVDPTWNGAATQSGNIGRTGRVGIGTISPSAPLHVAGSVRIVDGTQGNRRMLQSDANGNASWIGAPGVDYAESSGGTTISTSSSTSHINTVTISAPGPGYVIVTASGCLAHTVTTTGSFLARIKVSSTINDVSESPGLQFIRRPYNHVSSTSHEYPFSVSKVFNVSAAGTYNFYLNIWHQTVNGSLRTDEHTLIGHFVPNRY
jgi:hypothetical protein